MIAVYHVLSLKHKQEMNNSKLCKICVGMFALFISRENLGTSLLFYWMKFQTDTNLLIARNKGFNMCNSELYISIIEPATELISLGCTTDLKNNNPFLTLF